MSDPSYVRIFDTTLRDGEQSPGATLTSAEKLQVAEALARLGVDVIEAGFPAASPDDLRAVQGIAGGVGQSAATPSGQPPIITGLARATRGDVETAWKGVEAAARPRIHTFLATSDIHLEHKLRMSRQQVIDRVGEMVALARSLCEDVEFSPEDAGRSEPAFLYQVLATAIEAGATTLNIPDTVGYTTPEEYGALIAGIRQNTPGIADCVVSVHCHDDLGLATANSLAGVQNGARQIEVAMNGIGERAGNTPLEEVVMALHTRRAFYGLRTGIDTTQLTRASRLVSSATGMVVQPNKAVVGANAFAHESGIHQDGMLKNQDTYEIMRPESVGASQTRLVLGKHSGRHAVKARLVGLGYSLDDDALDTLFARFKKLADRKKCITDADLQALVSDELARPHELYALADLQVACGTMGMPTATVRLRGPDGAVTTRAAVGTGPVDAAYKAIDDIVRTHTRLLEFHVHSVTEGIDALGEVTVRVRSERASSLNPQLEVDAPRVYQGHSAATDIVVASANAYLAAINKYLVAEGQGANPTLDMMARAEAAARTEPQTGRQP
ncbi:2-isopropylmalate synthase [Haliangium sp.]|uniref:2-isopropylmalate synthase n=1 Tax=Haliangium sp. TaxID=2663208 RepID=UPI003D0A32BD